MSVSRSILSSRNFRLVSESARLAPCLTKLSPCLNKHDYHVRSFSTTKAVKKQSELALSEKKLATLAEKEISFMNEYLQTYSEEDGAQDFEKDSQAFFDNSGFSLTIDEETENIVLTKKTEGRTLTVTFSKNEAPQSEDDLLDETQGGEDPEANVVEGQVEGQDENRLKEVENEGGLEENEEMGPTFSREHPFSVTVTSDKHPDVKLHFGCFGADDGNFLISTLNTEQSEKVSTDVAVGDLTEEYQQGLLHYFRTLGLSEEVIVYMFKYIDQKRFESNVNSMNIFKNFLK